jgi:heme A synthase
VSPPLDSPHARDGSSAPPPPRRRRLSLSPAAFARMAWGVGGYTLAVILWGYFLRISESGDGCGTDWPLCHGEVIPASPTFSTLVEFSHRLTSGVVLLAVLALAFVAFRSFPRGHALRFGAGAALVLTLTESLFGAVLVVFGWVAGDISLGRTLIRPVHVTNTFLLMASLALTAWWATRLVSTLPRPGPGALRPLVLPLLGVLALAWTGAWTGLAVTAFPAESLGEGLGQYVAPEHILIWLRMSHPVLALAVIVLLVRLARDTWALAQHRGDGALGRLAVGVGALAAVQLLAGPLTIAAGNPVGMRLFHLLLADLLWVALVLLVSARFESALHRPGRAPGGGTREPASPGAGHPRTPGEAPAPSALTPG